MKKKNHHEQIWNELYRLVEEEIVILKDRENSFENQIMIMSFIKVREWMRKLLNE